MPPENLQHRRTHHLLLASKLLNLRENVSPFTLVQDTLEQSGKPLVQEFIRRANVVKTRTIFVSFETLRKPAGIDVFIKARGKDLASLRKEISSVAAPTPRNLLVIDTLHALASSSATLPAFLSSLISPHTSLLATYHLDVPWTSYSASPYSPHPLTLLKYLSTTLLTVYSFSHILASKMARDRSLAEPVFGLAEDTEGVIRGIGANDRRGIIIEMEYRRKSGRGVQEWLFLPAFNQPSTSGPIVSRQKERVMLLEDHPLYRQLPLDTSGGASSDEMVDTTFNLSLTEKQRRDREGVVLPYFDAQRDEGGPGEGGRILYDMGEEDDFDEEEDEI